jgi:CRP-like cAMP-binding protein
MDENLEILRNTQVFSGIPLDRLIVYAYMAKRRHFKEGEYVLRQGQPVDHCQILIAGRAEVFREYADHLVKLHELRHHDLLGGLAFLTDIKHLFTVKAVTPVETLSLDRESLSKIIRQFPETTIKIAEVIFKRFSKMVDKLMEQQVHECVYIR